MFVVIERSPSGAATSARLLAAGPRSRVAEVAHSPVAAEIVGVELRAGVARRALGSSASELRDRECSLEDLWGPKARTLLDRLVEAPDAGTRVSILVDVLNDRVARANERGPTHAAMHVLQASGGCLSTQALADQLGTSTRQIHRRFIDEVGLAPKRCARIVRLRRLFVGRWRDGATAAADLGYSDQAHLIDDFRELMGSTPGRFFSGEDYVDATLGLGWLVTPRP